MRWLLERHRAVAHIDWFDGEETMTTNCEHCWHNSTNHTGATIPVCCWCGTRLMVTVDVPDKPTHGCHSPVARESNGAASALATLERARGALQEGRADAADDHLLEVMDQLAGWCSPHMCVTF